MTAEPIQFPTGRVRSLEPVGMGYDYHSPNPALKLTMHFSYLRGGSEPSAEIRAETVLPGISGHLVTARVKLNGPRSKDDFAKALHNAWEIYTLKIWSDEVELACQAVLEAMRQGSPTTEIDFNRDVAQDPPPLVSKLIQDQAITVLYGAGGSGKGYIATGICVAIAAGVDFCGLSVKRGNVLYLDFEDNEDEFYRRARAAAEGLGVKPRGVYYQECRQPIESIIEDLAARVKRDNIVLVVVDSAEAAMGDGNERLSSGTRANNLFNQLRCLGTTVLVIDHVTGEALKDKKLSGRPFDSVFKSNRARATWEVKKEQHIGSSDWHVGLFLTKDNRTGPLAPIGIRISRSRPGMVTFIPEDVRTSEVLSQATSMRYRIDGALKAGLVSISQIYDAVGAEDERDQNTVRVTVKRWVEKGRYVRMDQGGITRYGMAEQTA